MTENVSSLAPKISESLRGISQSGEDMKNALQLGDLEAKYKAFADRVDKIYDAQKANQRELTKDVQATRGGQVGLRQMPQMIGRAGAVAQQAGATGEMAGGAGLIGQVVGALGPWGILVAGLSAATVAANMLARQYQKVLPTIMDVTAAFGELKLSAEDTSLSFKTTMKDVMATTEEFGYTLEQGLGIMRTFAEAGVTRPAAIGALGDVAAWARGMGIPPEDLARYQAMGMRFGIGGNLFGMAAGGLRQSGMGLGQFQEFLNATLSVFEEGLSRGIVQGFGDINLAQTWIAQLGDAFRGQYGLNLFRKMDEAAVRGTELQSEQDVIVFRAARRLMKEQGLDTSDYVDVMKLLESGAKFTPALFGQIRNIVEQMTGGNVNDMVELFREIYGLNYTVAEKILDLDPVKAVKELTTPKIPQDTPQMTLLRVQQEIRNEVIDVGEDIAIIKGQMIYGVEKIVELARKMLTGEGVTTPAELPTQMGGRGTPGYQEIWGGALGVMGRAKRKLPGAREIIRELRDLPVETQMKLAQTGFFAQAMQRALEYNPLEEREAYRDRREVVSEYDFIEVLRLLVKHLDALNINLGKEQMILIQNFLEEH
jgi:hypothetical protein